MANEPVRKTDNDDKPLVASRIEQNNEYIPFGVNDEDVQMYDSNGTASGSLRDFFQEWQLFKQAWQDLVQDSPAAFVNYGTNTPGQNNSSTINSKVKVWFDTNGE